MNAADIILAAVWVFIAALMMAQPWMTRKNVLFGVVFGTAGIWTQERAKQLRARYLLTEAACTAVLSALGLVYFLTAQPAEDGKVYTYLIGIGVLMVLEMAVFVAFHARTKAWKTERGEDPGLVTGQIVVDTSLGEKQTVVSGWWTLTLLPLLAAAWCVAVFGYGAMPQQIPVHYSFTAVDGWALKSWGTILLPLIMGTVLTGVIFFCILFTRRAHASVRGNPGAAPEAFRFRKLIIFLLIAVGVMMELSFLLMQVGFVTAISPLWFFLPGIFSMGMTVVIFYVYFRYVRSKKPRGPILDDDAKWKLGMFYYDPYDPSIFVEKRTGIGHTLNFAKPIAWIFMAGIVVMIIVSLVTATR